MNNGKYVPSDQDMEDRYVDFSLDRMDFPNDDKSKWAERLREEFQRGLARVRQESIGEVIQELQRVGMTDASSYLIGYRDRSPHERLTKERY